MHNAILVVWLVGDTAPVGEGSNSSSLCLFSRLGASPSASAWRLCLLWDAQCLLSIQAFICNLWHMRFLVCVVARASVWVLDTCRIGGELHLCALDRALSSVQTTPYGVWVRVCVAHTLVMERNDAVIAEFSPPPPRLSRARLKVCVWATMCVCVCVCECVCESEVCAFLTAASSLCPSTYRGDRDGTVKKGFTHKTHT